jgi:hypothetical protein
MADGRQPPSVLTAVPAQQSGTEFARTKEQQAEIMRQKQAGKAGRGRAGAGCGSCD